MQEQIHSSFIGFGKLVESFVSKDQIAKKKIIEFESYEIPPYKKSYRFV